MVSTKAPPIREGLFMLVPAPLHWMTARVAPYLFAFCAAGRILDTLTGHAGPVSRVDFSPVENVMVSSSWDKVIKVLPPFKDIGRRQCTSFVLHFTWANDQLSFRWVYLIMQLRTLGGMFLCIYAGLYGCLSVCLHLSTTERCLVADRSFV